MALSSLTFPTRGRGPYPLAGLDYLLTAHLSATVNGTPATATFDDGAKTMTLAADPPAGATVVIQRTTPRREEQRLTQYLSLPSGQGGLTAALLDQDFRQTMLLNGEGRDLADALEANPDAMMFNVGFQWEGEAQRVETILPGVGPNDAVAKSQLDTVVAGVRNLPTTVLDADDGLAVVAGEWDDLAPAGFRTALQLGTVAPLTSGTGANQVPAFSGDSPPRYPTADGRNIDLTSHAIQAEVLKRNLATVVRWSQQGILSPGVDPSSAAWSQNSATRMNLSGGWNARVDLNNGGTVDGSGISPYRIRLFAGTWRIRWMFKPRMPIVGSATNKTSLRLTNSDDTSAQVVYYDLGLHRPSVDFLDSGDYSIFPDSVVLVFGSASDVVFRYSNFASGGNNDCNFAVLFQRLKA